MSERKKIVMFLQSGVAGAERMTVLYGRSLPVAQYEVKFFPVVKNDKTDNCITDFIPQGYEVELIDANNSIRLCAAIVRIIAKESPDYVFSSVLYLNDKILLFRRLFRKTRFVIRCENYWYTFTANQQKLIKLLYGRADTIIAQTKEMKEELVENTGIPSAKIKILENPIDRDAIDKCMENCATPYPDDGLKHFVAVGRFSHQKGFDLLVKAFHEMYQSNTRASLYIVGTFEGTAKPSYDIVTDLVKQYRLEDSVHFVGYQRNPYPYIRYADSFVLSSRWEGLPNVLIEALYLGTPVAAFACIPFVGRTIIDGENGYLAEAENVHQLAVAMHEAGKMGRCRTLYNGTTKEEIINIFFA